jgi:2-polyprenyl-3-methyl-5-hydroxy-6-metoxy-1,4-benzoquinol methylase
MLATAVEGVSPRFLSLLAQEDLASLRVLDVGCGAGRVALALAPASRWVVGLDREADLIAEARRRAERAGLANAILPSTLWKLSRIERPELVTLPILPGNRDVVLSSQHASN